MAETERYHAQLVMKREDGRSILDEGAARAAGPGALNVSAARAAEIRTQLEAHGFVVTTGNLNTLSISAPREVFVATFGLEVARGSSGGASHATKIPDDLEDCVADVFVPPAPEFFR